MLTKFSCLTVARLHERWRHALSNTLGCLAAVNSSIRQIFQPILCLLFVYSGRMESASWAAQAEWDSTDCSGVSPKTFPDSLSNWLDASDMGCTSADIQIENERDIYTSDSVYIEYFYRVLVIHLHPLWRRPTRLNHLLQVVKSYSSSALIFSQGEEAQHVMLTLLQKNVFVRSHRKSAVHR